MVTPYAPARDGLADYAAILVSELSAEGHDVRVLASRPARDSPPEVLGSVPRTPLGAAEVARRVTAVAPDVVHVQFCIAAFAMAVPGLIRLLGLLRRSGIRIVLTLHDVSRDVATLGAPGRAVYRAVAGAGDAVVVHTEAARRVLAEITDRSRGDTIVVPHPRPRLPAATVEAAELRARFGLSDRRVLLAFGFVHVDKGLDDLVRALALLRRARGQEVADVVIAVAGAVRRRHGVFRVFELCDRVHLRGVRDLVRETGLERAVLFCGYVPSGEVRAWFELADAAVLPYRRIEQSGVASLAQSAGTQVLATDVGELAAIVGRAEWCCRPGSPQALAKVLERFLESRHHGPVGGEEGEGLERILGATLDVYRARPSEPAIGGCDARAA